MPTWLITGASGFLGANAGLALGGRVNRVGLARGPVPTAAFDSSLSVDLRDHPAVTSAIETLRPDVVLHCAALASHEECERDPDLAMALNCDSARMIARACESAGSQLLHISTDAVFSGESGDYRESDTTSPFSIYGQSKLAGEHAVAQEMPSALIVRTNFFGWSPSGTRSILEFFVRGLRDGQSLQGYSDFVVTSIYVGHLIPILERLAGDQRTGVVHVAAADALSKLDFGREVARALALPDTLISPVSAAEGGHATSRARNLSLSTDLLAAWLGSRPSTQEAGIREALTDEGPVTRSLRGD